MLFPFRAKLFTIPISNCVEKKDENKVKSGREMPIFKEMFETTKNKNKRRSQMANIFFRTQNRILSVLYYELY